MDQIIQSCHCKAYDTFTRFYLKELTWLDIDNNMPLGSIVAAQQILGFSSLQCSQPQGKRVGRHNLFSQALQSLKDPGGSSNTAGLLTIEYLVRVIMLPSG